MNIVNATTLRNNFSDALDQVISSKENYLLVARRGKIKSALVNIDLFEDLLALTNKKYLNSIKKAREEYKRGETFSHKQAFGEV